jgi:hypothetical protein
MAIFKPEVKVTLFPKKTKKTDEIPIEEPTVDYVAAAEAAAGRLGKQLVIGAIVVSVASIAAATLGSIAITAVDHALTK